MKLVLVIFILLSINSNVYAVASNPGYYYVSSERLNVRLAANKTGRITNTLDKRQKVKVFEIRNGWARISSYYEGWSEGVSGDVARWVFAKNLSSNRPKEVTVDVKSPIVISKLPENAGGLILLAPDVAKDGNIVPVTIKIEEPLKKGDILMITGDGEEALKLKTNKLPITLLSTRLRLKKGKIVAYVIRGSGKINSVNKKLKITVSATQPPNSGNNGVLNKVSSNGKEIKMMIFNDMALKGHIKDVIILSSNAAFVKIFLTPVIAKNPYLSLKSTNKFKDVKVKASIK